MCSPSQEGPSDGDICAELKEFIVSENSKCVKEIRDSNDRRIAAVEESLSFAMDSLTAISERQRSADIDILQLQRETAELRRRLQQLELSEDREQQEKRLTSLVFSGPALQSKTSREDAARLIRSLVQQRMEHVLDSAQVKAMIRLRNGRVLIDFTTATPGSDRDVLFRNKTKLKGTGLFVAESLTPRRQAMFSDLLRLKKEGIIFSVFTRSGVILACRSRDSAPIRIADPEAVRQLAEAGAARDPAAAQGRAQAATGGGVSSGPRTEGWRPELERERRTSELGGAVERGAPSPSGASRSAVPGSHPGPGGSDDAANRRRVCSTSSSLLECARGTPVSLVRLSPPLEPVSPADAAATADRSAGGGDCGLAGARDCSVSPGVRPAAARPAGTDDLETPMDVTSGAAPPPVTAQASGGNGRR